MIKATNDADEIFKNMVAEAAKQAVSVRVAVRGDLECALRGRELSLAHIRQVPKNRGDSCGPGRNRK